ncbi:hypothetical protein FHS31_002175 [Sphingomonas vulcanisoli]|uniref:DUF1838 domain-containing protein n=1 Tax=Sphingomonas vulcanisoli TaxID=1658060 RepID=A0ABX0TWN8_9SPHN|nr:DUF1838 family protein [Sphingomonas vulcanisoli]NIJ08554.1 hypothetical protein [Sphingomonas vulcanisoli]
MMRDIDVARRDLLALGVMSAGSLAVSAAASPRGVPVKPTAQAVELFARLVGDLSGKVTLSYMAGTVWGFRPQADDLKLADFARRIYGYKSLVARKVRRLANGDFAIKQQGWTFYADPETDVITDTLRNPYTGLDVKPYSPPSAPAEMAYRPDGSIYLPGKEGVNPLGNGESATFANPFDMRVKTIGAHSFVDTAQFIRFKPGNIDWFKLEATLIGYVCRTADLANPRLTHVPSTATMNLVAEWQTWMNMHGAPGHILFKGEGGDIASIADTPADYRAALASKFPGQLEKALAW